MRKNSFKFKYLLLISLLSFISCSNNNTSNDILSSSSIYSNDISIESYNDSTISSSEEISSISKYESEEISSIKSADLSSFSSSEKESFSSISNISSKQYEELTIPENSNNPIDISAYQNFSFVDELPEYFSYIYGNNKTKPEIYADGGGLIMNENDGPRKGVQTPCFNSWNKIELKIHLGRFHGTQKKQNKTDPIFTIDCYSIDGTLLETTYIEDIDVTNNSTVKTYIRNSSISYIEIRTTNLPVKSNQVYNFGISGITLKGWIYD